MRERRGLHVPTTFNRRRAPLGGAGDGAVVAPGQWILMSGIACTMAAPGEQGGVLRQRREPRRLQLPLRMRRCIIANTRVRFERRAQLLTGVGHSPLLDLWQHLGFCSSLRGSLTSDVIDE